MFVPREIESVIASALRRRMQNYNPEPSDKPFHTRLLGEDRMALYSFIQSLNTNFGTAIFERVAEQIATGEFDEVELQREVSGTLSADAQAEITRIINDLSAAESDPNHETEMERLRQCAQSGGAAQKKMTNVDVFLVKGDTRYMIDLKTAKPNMRGFQSYKQDLLEWAATVLYENPEADVRTVIAIPYNPYAPRPYRRWTIRGMLEIENQSQLMVAEEFWNFLAGGQDIYQDLLDCFERVGIQMRDEIDSYFERFAQGR